MNADELNATKLQGVSNILPIHFTDGSYYNFPESQKICDGVYFIKAKGHTDGNSLVIAENEGLFYMFQAGITYIDEALYQNKLSVVYDNLNAARERRLTVCASLSKCPRCKQSKEKFNKA